MLLRRAVLAAALASAAAYSPVAGSLRSLEAPRRSAVRAKSDDEETIKPPIGFRPLSDQEVVDKLNGVPTFSVVNSAGQVVATPDAEGNLRASFYLDLSEAQATFEGIRTANPGVDVNLHVAPLGSVWALSEWDEPLGDDDDGRDAAAAEEAADLESAKEPGEVGAGAVRLCASASEVEAVGSLLRQSPGPPLLRRRNVKEGPVPLFGSDAIRFKESADSEDDLSARRARPPAAPRTALARPRPPRTAAPPPNPSAPAAPRAQCRSSSGGRTWRRRGWRRAATSRRIRRRCR